MSDNVQVINHPLIRHKLALLRDKNTTSRDFRNLVKEMAMLMGYEVLRDLPTEDVKIETPFETTTAHILAGKKICLVSILRAGNGLLDGMLELLPAARVGHIGLYRDPDTLVAVEYYLKFPPDMEERQVIVVDPMLATGHSAIAAIDRIKGEDVRDIKFLCLIAAPEGLNSLFEAHPDVQVYTAAIDRELDDHGYIRPGIGDAGDRIFGTK